MPGSLCTHPEISGYMLTGHVRSRHLIHAAYGAEVARGGGFPWHSHDAHPPTIGRTCPVMSIRLTNQTDQTSERFGVPAAYAATTLWGSHREPPSGLPLIFTPPPPVAAHHHCTVTIARSPSHAATARLIPPRLPPDEWTRSVHGPCSVCLTDWMIPLTWSHTRSPTRSRTYSRRRWREQGTHFRLEAYAARIDGNKRSAHAHPSHREARTLALPEAPIIL